ncbi:MAG TPA: bifunctional hydroxymethylpyrimidine kinase/phosphomethylpyrimidine kinase [Bryobacteraceae bacterium]|nr:bifunctional hydroxymethylpyrimidine kinase/phosphomethylpyrimidine kinase [Bryobacteraceae bacterium]
MIPVALTIAGSDPSGGAGLEADLKTFYRFGVYGEAVVTLIAVQNTLSVTRVETLAPDLVRDQIRAATADIVPQAAKTGALGSAGVVEAVADSAAQFGFPLVVDPVRVASRGVTLLDRDGWNLFVERLLPRAFLLTPNLEEASVLAGFAVNDLVSMRRAAEKLAGMGAANVLVKGGHLADAALDVLFSPAAGFQEFCAGQILSRHTHGTGCTYSAAITAALAKGANLTTAIERAKDFVTRAIRTAPGLGAGSGPVNHFA